MQKPQVPPPNPFGGHFAQPNYGYGMAPNPYLNTSGQMPGPYGYPNPYYNHYTPPYPQQPPPVNDPMLGPVNNPYSNNVQQNVTNPHMKTSFGGSWSKRSR